MISAICFSVVVNFTSGMGGNFPGAFAEIVGLNDSDFLTSNTRSLRSWSDHPGSEQVLIPRPLSLTEGLLDHLATGLLGELSPAISPLYHS
jgi:hypothetical protein